MISLVVVTIVIVGILVEVELQKTRIQEIESFDQASTILNTADKNSLVIFGVKNTLIYPAETINQTWFEQSTRGQRFFEKLEENTATKADPQAYTDMVLSKMHFADKMHAVELQIKTIVQKLQDRGVKTIAITSCSTGSVGIITSMQSWLFEKLAQLSINFSTSFNPQEIELNKITTLDSKPLFYKGILLTDFIDRGIALGAFLDTIKYKPDQIIFFDNDQQNIESIKNEAKKRGIPFHGFIYKAAAKLPKQYDSAIIDLQCKYIIEHDEYITEQQARELLKK